MGQPFDFGEAVCARPGVGGDVAELQDPDPLIRGVGSNVAVDQSDTAAGSGLVTLTCGLVQWEGVQWTSSTQSNVDLDGDQHSECKGMGEEVFSYQVLLAVNDRQNDFVLPGRTI